MRGALTTGAFVRGTATVTAAAFLALSAGPALAADPLAQAEGEAISGRIAGQSVTAAAFGPYRVVDTGNGPQATGNNRPRLTALAGQQAAQLGTLAQDARTTVRSGRGSSAACAGVAGDGASLVAVGDGGEFCVTPGESVQLTAGNLDLDQITQTDLLTAPGAPDIPSSLADLLEGLGGAGDPLADGIRQLNEQLQVALEPFGDAGLVLDVGAIQSRCTAGPGNQAEGSARLTDVGAFLQLPDEAPVDRITLLDLPTDPRPNTNVATDLSDVADLVVDALVRSLGRSDVPEPLRDAITTIKDQVRDNLLVAIEDQLGPLDENLLSGTLNKQTRSPGAIEVTALDLQVLPVLQDQAGFSAVDLQVGRSACGPGGQADQPDPPSQPNEPDRPDAPPAGGTTPQDPAVPRSVPAGLADDSDGVPPMLALAALTVLATATGLAVHRRRSQA